MAFTHVFTTTIEPLTHAAGGGFSSVIDTRGCDLIVFVISADANSGPLCSDNQGNYYFHNLGAATYPAYYKNTVVYSVGPTDHFASPLVTSATHVFELAGGTYNQSCIIYGFSGVDSSDPLDISGLGKSKDTSLTPLADYIDADAVTPSLNGNLIITGCTFGHLQSVIADSPFDGPLSRYFFSSGVHYGNAATYLIQNPAALVTPRFASVLTPGPLAATVTVFNVGGGGSGGGGGGPPAPGGAGDDGFFDAPRFVHRQTASASPAEGASPPSAPVPEPPAPTPETPDTHYRLTEAGDRRITEIGESRITES